MGNDKETKRQEQENVVDKDKSSKANTSLRPKKYRTIKGINGDFTIVDEHGRVVGRGMGF